MFRLSICTVLPQAPTPPTSHTPPTTNANAAQLCCTPLLRPPATKRLAATVPRHKQNGPKRRRLTSFGPSVSFFYVPSSCFSRLTNNSLHLLANVIITTLHPRNDTRLPPTAASLCSQGGLLARMGMIATGHDRGHSKQWSPKRRRRPSTCSQPCEQLLAGWIVGATNVDNDNEGNGSDTAPTTTTTTTTTKYLPPALRATARRVDCGCYQRRRGWRGERVRQR